MAAFITIYLHINIYIRNLLSRFIGFVIMVEISLDIICSLFYIKTCTNCLINNMQVVLKYIYLKKNHSKTVIKKRAWSSFKTTDGLFPKAQIRCSALGKQQSVSDYIVPWLLHQFGTFMSPKILLLQRSFEPLQCKALSCMNN